MSRSLVGERFDLDAGPVGHGGFCVARLPAGVPEVGGTVVFVRHALPGERVTARITEGSVGDRFLRADAVAVDRASPDRVPPPCRYAGPPSPSGGGCGGCDFQHASLPAQRELKAAVVCEQLRRIAGLDLPVTVEAVPGDLDGLRYRTRMRFHRLADGRLGLRQHRSAELVAIDDCLIQAPGAHVVIAEDGGSGSVTEIVRGHRFDVAADGFWQAHAGAPAALVDAVLEGAAVRAGERVVELFSGVGLFTRFLGEAVGPAGHVLAVEGDRTAAEHARANLAAYPWVEVRRGSVDRVLSRGPHSADVVVLDPPRVGAKRRVVEQVVALAPRAVVHVACDPASLARDVALFGQAGYALTRLRAFDLFPMTHHVECVALLSASASDLR